MQNDSSITEALSSYFKMKDAARARALVNRDRIIDALKQLDITRVVIAYSGSGDSGQIDEVSLYRGNDLVEVKTELTMQTYKSRWDADLSKWLEYSADESYVLPEALQNFVYDWIESEYSGWENNDGASGECTIEVSTNEFNLNHITYYTESESEWHTL